MKLTRQTSNGTSARTRVQWNLQGEQSKVEKMVDALVELGYGWGEDMEDGDKEGTVGTTIFCYSEQIKDFREDYMIIKKGL